MTLLERLRVLSNRGDEPLCLSQEELDTIMAAIRYIEVMERAAYSPEVLRALLDEVPR